MNHAIYAPKAYGKTFSEEADPTVILRLTPELSPEDEKTEFSQYYHLGAVPPSVRTTFMLEPGNELPPEDGFLPFQYSERMVTAGYDRVEDGVCVLENGVAFAALRTELPGVNDEIQQYFNDHFANGTGDLFYKVWCPGAHLRLYPDLALEDMGWGMCEVRITRAFTAEEFGIAVDPIKVDPAFIDFQAMNLEIVPLGAPAGTEPLRMVEANYFRQNENGREIRHRFWVGLAIEDGKAVAYPVESGEQALKYARLTAMHSGTEFATLNRNLHRFYESRHPEE